MGIDNAAAWIDLVIRRARDLRAAGVTSIGIDGCTATLGPEPIAADSSKPAAPDPEPHDHFHDPATYPHGIVPGFEIRRLEEE